MTKPSLLSTAEQYQFDSPPIFEDKARHIYFSLNHENSTILQKLRLATTKVGFILQLGYFKANGKFYTPQQFRKDDIKYVCKMLGVSIEKIDFTSYQKKILIGHRKENYKIDALAPS